MTKTSGTWPFHVDLDSEGEVIGIEVMDAGKYLQADLLEKNK